MVSARFTSSDSSTPASSLRPLRISGARICSYRPDSRSTAILNMRRWRASTPRSAKALAARATMRASWSKTVPAAVSRPLISPNRTSAPISSAPALAAADSSAVVRLTDPSTGWRPSARRCSESGSSAPSARSAPSPPASSEAEAAPHSWILRRITFSGIW